MSDPKFEYSGAELAVFANAVHWKRYCARQIGPFIQARVLEVGAGIGTMTCALYTDPKQVWTCLEPDAKLANRLEQLHPTLPSAPRVITGTIRDLSVNEKFDTILYIDVLEHIEDDRTELRQAHRLLAPDGHLIVLSPSHSWLFSPFDKAIGHCRRYNRRTLKAAAPGGLRLVSIRYLDSVGLLASAANRLLLKSPDPTTRQIAFWDKTLVPISRIIDPMFSYHLGKSLVAVWRAPKW